MKKLEITDMQKVAGGAWYHCAGAVAFWGAAICVAAGTAGVGAGVGAAIGYVGSVWGLYQNCA